MKIRAVVDRQLLRPWFAGYALIGLVVSGIVPILIPLSADPKGPVAVGLVVAAFYLGTLIAPVFGSLADRTGRQRTVFLASFPIIGAAAMLFPLADRIWSMFLCMFVAGAGAGAAQTTASMFIVEGRPRSEWAERMGWIRLAFGAGQVGGLGVAAWFTHRLDAGWVVVGVIMVLGTGLGALRLPRIQQSAPVSPDSHRHHRMSLAGVRTLLTGRFGVFLGAWLFAMIGLMSFYNVVPLVLRDAFDIRASTTSLIFLGGSAVGAVFYPVTGYLARRIGSALVLTTGVGTTLLAFVVLSTATLLHSTAGAALGGIALMVIAAVYPFGYIGATLLAAEIAPGGEGSAMGLFNSGVAAGAVVGALLPMGLSGRHGYDMLPWISLSAMAVAAILLAILLRQLRVSGQLHPAPAA